VLVTGIPITRASTLAGAALIQAPATLALTGFVVAVFGLLPRWTGALCWAGLTLSLLLGPVGGILSIPDTVRNLSPFTHTPAFPAARVTATPILALLAIAAALTTLGTALFRRRDPTLPT
jgi:ABC-2 type transport system permease protein